MKADVGYVNKWMWWHASETLTKIASGLNLACAHNSSWPTPALDQEMGAGSYLSFQVIFSLSLAFEMAFFTKATKLSSFNPLQIGEINKKQNCFTDAGA